MIHKIIINEKRGRKSEKDRRSIEHLMPHLNRDKFEEIVGHLTKSEKKTVEKYFR